MRKVYIGLILLLGLGLVFSTTNTVANAKPVPKKETVKFMSYNINYGRSSDGNRIVDLERTAQVIRDSGADIIGLQEVDRFYSARSNYEDQLKVLAELLGYHYVYAANLDLAPHEGYDVRQYGTGFLSKYPIVDSENTYLNSFGKEQRGILRATVNVKGIKVNVFNTHLALADEERMEQIREITDLLSGFSGPKVLLGDLNTEPDFEDFQLLLNESNLNDTFEGIENANTFRAIDPIKRIDFILTSPLIEYKNQEVIQTLASDHLPVVIDATIWRNAR